MKDISNTLKQARDYNPKSNPVTIRNFISSTLHTDFLNELAVRIESMRDFNEECPSNMYLETRGGIKALRLAAEIFTDLLNNAESDLAQPEQSEEI